MGAPKRARSSAQKVDDGFKFLVSLRKRYGIPQVQSADEVDPSEWPRKYADARGGSIKRHEVDEARTAVRLLVQTFGRVPWEHEPKDFDKPQPRRSR